MPRFSILYYTISYGFIFHSSILYYPFYQTNLTREDRDAPTRDDWVVTPGAGYLRRLTRTCLECGFECERCYLPLSGYQDSITSSITSSISASSTAACQICWGPLTKQHHKQHHKHHHKRSRKHQFIAQRRKGITTKRKKQPAAGAVGRELLYVAL